MTMIRYVLIDRSYHDGIFTFNKTFLVNQEIDISDNTNDQSQHHFDRNSD